MKKLMVLVAALALVAGSAMTAAAADWNFYGSSRVSTFYEDYDLADVTNYEQALQGNARIGANVKVSDELTGRFEYGTGVNVRILWGEWDFGGGQLGIGQHYSPLNMFYSNQVFGADTDLLAYGGVYGGREAMIQLSFGDFQIAAINPSAPAGAETDFPAIEVSYDLKMDAFSLALAGGYQTYDLGATDIDSWVVALGGKVNLGAGYVGGNVYAGQNAGDLMWIDTGNPAYGDGKGTAAADVDNMGFIIAAGFKANDMFAFEAGYGYAEVELDVSGSKADEVQSYYVQSTITLAPGVFITPEIGVIDYDEAGQEELMYYGAKWQINF
ncbi:MAG: hypothetical protein V2J08_10665 [Desulfotignum sp.]|nr:hypothetical protein [Desulfotignum sp.]